MNQPANGKHLLGKLEIGHILTALAIIVSMAVAWGVITTRLEQNTAAVKHIAEMEEKLDEKILRLREKQADLEARIKNVEAQEAGMAIRTKMSLNPTLSSKPSPIPQRH
jgi:low affinity Fe/Cu permease